MSVIELTGQLICASRDEVEIVQQLLPRHTELSRAEPGCIHFDVVQTENPFVWTVTERFENQQAFDNHQRRVLESAWGHATAAIKREYLVRPIHSET